MSPARIWHQSYVDYEHGKIYWDRLRAHPAQIADLETVIDVKGITPHDSYAHPLVEFRCAREVICNAVAAEEQGYDAFVIGAEVEGALSADPRIKDVAVVPVPDEIREQQVFACIVATSNIAPTRETVDAILREAASRLAYYKLNCLATSRSWTPNPSPRLKNLDSACCRN